MNPRRELLSVRIGEQEFALDIGAIREIRGWIASTYLPHAPFHVIGMINLRGSALLVIDLAARLGLKPRAPDAASVVVVVESGDRVAGLLVDAVCDIITVSEAQLQATPETGSAVPRQFIEGLVMTEARIISIVSVPAILPDPALAGVPEMA
jgi:purine-binding chemotaxis protein CheW